MLFGDYNLFHFRPDLGSRHRRILIKTEIVNIVVGGEVFFISLNAVRLKATVGRENVIIEDDVTRIVEAGHIGAGIEGFCYVIGLIAISVDVH